ncbi:response regulator [Alphaproteobacteria bacterium]|nr:response regulator [Alphaproteobacteria bacterium]
MAYDFKDLSVLIVEDNAPVRDITASILQTFGCKKIYTARNGEEGFVEFCIHSPDLVITDWMMHPLDGFDMAELMRTHSESPNPYAPVILMTAFTQHSKILRARDVGVTEIMVKPFSARDLYKRLVQVIEKPRRFVKSDNFFGPDRRRQVQDYFKGTYKRETDVRPEDYITFKDRDETN